MTTACPRAPCDEKNREKKKQQQTYPRGEDKKESNISYLNVRNVLLQFETQTFLE